MVYKMYNQLDEYSYNTGEKSLLGAFFAEISDITIYIEDTADGMRNFYKKLLEQRFPKITIDHIVALGKKADVIKFCTERPYQNLNEIFIVDGDLDLILCKKNKIRSLFQHNVYCIENYLIDEEAVSNFISDELGTIDDINIIKKNLNLNIFLDKIFSSFIEIYKIFAIIYKNQLDIPTVSRFNDSIYIQKKGTYTMLNDEIIKHEYNEVKNAIISKKGNDFFEKELNEIQNYIKHLNPNDYRKIISVKKEILYLIKSYSHFIARNIDSKCNNIIGFNLASFKVKLAKYTKHENLNELFNAIETTIKNGYYEE